MPFIDTPDDLSCPISKDLFTDPVVAADGHSYDRSSIVKWMASCDEKKKPLHSPVTGEVLHTNSVFPNLELKHRVSQFQRSLLSPVEFAAAVERGDISKLRNRNYPKHFLAPIHRCSKLPSVGLTPLQLAVMAVQVEAVKFFCAPLEAFAATAGGSTIDLNATASVLGLTALHMAAYVPGPAAVEIVQVLLAAPSANGGKIHVNSKSVTGETPLHWAARHQSPSPERPNHSVLQLLLDAGANPDATTHPDAGRRTPLHESKDIITVAALIRAGASIYQRDAHDQTFLMIVAGRRTARPVSAPAAGSPDPSLALFSQILNLHAPDRLSSAICDKSQRTILHTACGAGNADLIDYILNPPSKSPFAAPPPSSPSSSSASPLANWSILHPDHADDAGNTALHFLAGNLRGAEPAPPAIFMRALKLIVDAGTCNLANHNGLTAFEIALLATKDCTDGTDDTRAADFAEFLCDADCDTTPLVHHPALLLRLYNRLLVRHRKLQAALRTAAAFAPAVDPNVPSATASPRPGSVRLPHSHVMQSAASAASSASSSSPAPALMLSASFPSPASVLPQSSPLQRAAFSVASPARSPAALPPPPCSPPIPRLSPPLPQLQSRPVPSASSDQIPMPSLVPDLSTTRKRLPETTLPRIGSGSGSGNGGGGSHAKRRRFEFS